MADQPTPTGNSLRCVVVTPEATVLNQPADFVAVPLFDGELGILPRRAPMVGRLGFGELRLKSGGAVERFYVDGGFVQVQDNVVSILTGKSLAKSELEVDAARQQLDEARNMQALTPEETAIRQRLVNQSRAQLRMAERP